MDLQTEMEEQTIKIKKERKPRKPKMLKVSKIPKVKKVVDKNYVKNKDLYNELVICLEQDKLTTKAENMFFLIAENLALKKKYRNSDDKKDCISFANLDLLRYWKNFNPKYLNAFAYFTEIAKKGLAKGWNALYPKKYKGTISMDGGSSSSNNDSNNGSGIYTI